MKITSFLSTFAFAGLCALPCHAAPNSTAKTSQGFEKEVVVLREKVQKQEQMLRYWRELAIGEGGSAVRAPFGRFLLIKYGSQCLALRITEHRDFRTVENAERYTSRYEWFLQSDGSMDFSKKNVQKGKGELSEVKKGTFAPNYVKASPFPRLEWSTGDWIYFTVGGTPVGGHQPGSEQALREKNLRIASTEWVRIEDVKPQSQNLAWLSKTQK